jgi:hypothetical protein
MENSMTKQTKRLTTIDGLTYDQRTPAQWAQLPIATCACTQRFHVEVLGQAECRDCTVQLPGFYAIADSPKPRREPVRALEVGRGAWIIRCRVSGGVTGTRESILKRDGVIATFDEAEARAEAARLHAQANGPHATARFAYWPAPSEAPLDDRRGDNSPVAPSEILGFPSKRSTSDKLENMGPIGRRAEAPEPICRRCEQPGSLCACEPCGDFA